MVTAGGSRSEGMKSSFAALIEHVNHVSGRSSTFSFILPSCRQTTSEIFAGLFFHSTRKAGIPGHNHSSPVNQAVKGETLFLKGYYEMF